MASILFRFHLFTAANTAEVSACSSWWSLCRAACPIHQPDYIHLEEPPPPLITHNPEQGQGDAGYYVTARWLLETALCMALQGPALRSTPGLVQGGVLTPSSACGGVLLERLRAAGTQFEVTNVRAP